ncbi:MAG: molybdate ABC transporter substrate-binding protein, partial [Lachnospiraceae bacterium]|nr:molybdate ABC transporter substrate-binding protein [Lachnospiraceae bacterium]
MKKAIAVVAAAVMLLGSVLAGCGTATDGGKAELIVFAAASMTETLTQIAEKYKTVAPDVTLTFQFDSSGTLKTQIEEGAACDIFISAAPKQMNALDAEKDAEGGNEKGQDFLLPGTRTNLLKNEVTLAVPDGNPKGLNSFDDLAKGLQEGSVLLAMGNEDVPVGQYTQKIFDYYGLKEEDL